MRLAWATELYHVSEKRKIKKKKKGKKEGRKDEKKMKGKERKEKRRKQKRKKIKKDASQSQAARGSMKTTCFPYRTGRSWLPIFVFGSLPP